jgi:hypothetical protein
MSLLPQTFWLTAMNIALGALVVLGCLAAAAGRLSGALSRLRKRRSYAAELDHDMEQMFGPRLRSELLGRVPRGSRAGSRAPGPGNRDQG